MAPSIITKKKIAKAFKILLAKEEFEKISIVEIMELANIRRQTFYNHFIDKYQLMDWIFENDLKEKIIDNLDFITGRQLLIELFIYFKEEKDFYTHLFSVRGQNDFNSYFINYCKSIVEKIIKEYPIKKEYQENEPFLNFHIKYHSYALAEIIKDFVSHSSPIPDVDFLIFEMTYQKI